MGLPLVRTKSEIKLPSERKITKASEIATRRSALNHLETVLTKLYTECRCDKKTCYC